MPSISTQMQSGVLYKSTIFPTMETNSSVGTSLQNAVAEANTNIQAPSTCIPRISALGTARCTRPLLLQRPNNGNSQSVHHCLHYIYGE